MAAIAGVLAGAAAYGMFMLATTDRFIPPGRPGHHRQSGQIVSGYFQLGGRSMFVLKKVLSFIPLDPAWVINAIFFAVECMLQVPVRAVQGHGRGRQ